MKIFKKKRTKKVGVISILLDIILVCNFICGIFVPVLYYYIGTILGIIALLLIIKKQVDLVQKVQHQQLIERIKRNIEEEEYEKLLNEAKKEADVAVNIQLKKIYRQQLRKAILDVCIEKELVLNTKLIKSIESEFITGDVDDLKSDEEIHNLVAKAVGKEIIK